MLPSQIDQRAVHTQAVLNTVMLFHFTRRLAKEHPSKQVSDGVADNTAGCSTMSAPKAAFQQNSEYIDLFDMCHE